MGKIKLGYMFLLLSILIVLPACKKDAKQQIAIDEYENVEESYTETQEAKSPLSGVYVEKEKLNRRIIGVMFDNHPKARWQAGLKDAEVVYEYEVEAPYTRYLGLFLINDPSSIGPIRSARPYFAMIASEYDALYVRCGGSREADADIKRYNIDDLDARVSSSDIFWRKKHKSSPNNLYSDMKTLRTVAEERGLERKSTKNIFSFNREDVDINGFDGNEINIVYYKSNTTDYIYNKDEKVYYRKKDGKDHIDEEDNTPITAKNIIIREVVSRPIEGGKKLEMDLIGKGRGKYFTNGKGIDINWIKKSRDERTIYTNENGIELKLNPGVTFIQVVNPKTNIQIRE